jgi:hypothetical protein
MGFAVCRLIVAALLLGAVAAVADVTAGGQVRSRWELRDTDGVASDGHTATRTRAGLSATLEGGVSAIHAMAGRAHLGRRGQHPR